MNVVKGNKMTENRLYKIDQSILLMVAERLIDRLMESEEIGYDETIGEYYWKASGDSVIPPVKTFSTREWEINV